MKMPLYGSPVKEVTLNREPEAVVELNATEP